MTTSGESGVSITARLLRHGQHELRAATAATPIGGLWLQDKKNGNCEISVVEVEYRQDRQCGVKCKLIRANSVATTQLKPSFDSCHEFRCMLLWLRSLYNCMHNCHIRPSAHHPPVTVPTLRLPCADRFSLAKLLLSKFGHSAYESAERTIMNFASASQSLAGPASVSLRREAMAVEKSAARPSAD
jgi:hypothetical protein